MTKEAVEYAEKINLQNVNISGVVRNHISQAYLAGTESREKQIQIDAEQIRALQKQNGELTDELTKKSDTNHQLVEQLAKLNERCSELEAQLARSVYFMRELIIDIDTPAYGYALCQAQKFIKEIKEK